MTVTMGQSLSQAVPKYLVPKSGEKTDWSCFTPQSFRVTDRARMDGLMEPGSISGRECESSMGHQVTWHPRTLQTWCHISGSQQTCRKLQTDPPQGKDVSQNDWQGHE
jgi:hypothetical protein